MRGWPMARLAGLAAETARPQTFEAVAPFVEPGAPALNALQDLTGSNTFQPQTDGLPSAPEFVFVVHAVSLGETAWPRNRPDARARIFVFAIS